MISNLELYGTEEVPLVPKGIANRRLELLQEQLKQCVSVSYMKQDNAKINLILKAQKHWTMLRDGLEIE